MMRMPRKLGGYRVCGRSLCPGCPRILAGIKCRQCSTYTSDGEIAESWPGAFPVYIYIQKKVPFFSLKQITDLYPIERPFLVRELPFEHFHLLYDQLVFHFRAFALIPR